MRNWLIPFIAVVLAFFSLITLKSVAPDLVGRQTIFFLMGFIIFYLGSKLKLSTLIDYSRFLYWGLALVLLGLLIVGKTTRGVTSWIDLGGGLKFQPSQLAIPFTSFYLISIFKKVRQFDWLKLAMSIVLIIIPGILILLEPDMGTAFVYFVSTSVILLIRKISFKYLLVLGSLLILVVSIGWLFLLKPYQKERVTGFVTGYSDDNSASYNAQQSLIAVGSGRLLGRGVGQGIQSHLRFLPERQTDFIYASLAEEWGLLGAGLVILLYFVLVLFLLRVAWGSQLYQQLAFSLVVSVMIAVQAGINMGMNLGILPITGITLPLLSYGGSSIVTILFMLGLMQGFVNKRTKGAILRFV